MEKESIYIKRHRLLGCIFPNYSEFNSSNKNPNIKFGVSFNELLDIFDTDMVGLEQIIAKLYCDKEVNYTDVDVVGLTMTVKGATSYSSEKYLNLEVYNKTKHLELKLATSNIKANTLTKRTSVISLIIATMTLLALVWQIIQSTTDKIENKKLQKEIQKEKVKTLSQQLLIKTYLHQIDSLELSYSSKNPTLEKIKKEG